MNKFMAWVDARFPATKMWEDHLSKYYAPKNFNFWYFFGSLALLVLVNQILTGIWLTMSFTPSAEEAFASVEYIMRDVDYGWIIRYMHSTGASAFFIVVYLHMFRGLLYGSYQKPRELVWIFGMLIYLALMAEAFMGYLLPWGQMSYWGAQVIISLFGAIPVVGEDLAQWIRGDFLISGITLNRFFALHVIALPIVLLGLVVLHILALHEVGSNNPDGVDIKKKKDENGVPLDGIGVPSVLHREGHRRRGGVPVHLLHRDLLLPGNGRLLPREAQLRDGQPVQDPRAHRSGLVLHPVLRDPPRGSGQADGRGGDGCGDRCAVRPAVAGSQPGSLDPLQGLAEQAVAGDLRGVLRDPRLLRRPGSEPAGYYPVARLHRPVFRLLHPDAVLHPDGEDQTGSGKGDWLMKKQFAALILAVLPVLGFAAGGHGPQLDHVDIDLTDKAAMQDGARTFANYCMGCHSAKFQRYERVATDLGIPADLMMEKLVFTGAKIGDHMDIGMKPADAKTWFGAAPPDLTLVARVRGTDWLYSYLRSFYEDPKRPWGVNNVIFPNVGMPNVLAPLQGRQVIGCKQVQVVEDGKKQFDPLTGTPLTHEACDQLTVVPKTGELNEAQFDEKVKNLVTFLAYSANPNKLASERIGTYVLLYLAFFFVFAYLLKREYWKDVH
ncbi:cytochrome c1 [Pseudomonas aeruginosa]|nr:cytochrome c1 [Pseudomonas aeruginosa]